MAKKAQLDAVRPVLEATDNALDKIEATLDALDVAADKGTDVVEAGLEKVADVVPDALDTTVHVSTKGGRKIIAFFRDPKHAAVTVVVLAGAAGASLGVLGYKLAVKRLRSQIEAEYDERFESEIAEMRRFYAIRNKEGLSTPAEAVDKLLSPEAAAALKDYRGVGNEPQNTTEVVTEDGPKLEVVQTVPTADVAALREKMQSGKPIEIVETTSNIFVDGRDITDFDYEAEVAKRSPDAPYVITHDEFMENENGWSQNTLTYYNGDDTLTDDRDMPIPDIEALVDSENLTKFGYGSKDKNVVYVRNERIETDFEINLSQGEFAKEVAGFQHSSPNSLRRFRRGDDE